MIDRRGIILGVEDLASIGEQWVEWLKAAGLNVVGLHDRVDLLLAFVSSQLGQRLLAALLREGIDIEYEIHTFSWLLPRREFPQHPEWFRMYEGQRTPDANFCPSNAEALNLVVVNAVQLARLLPPSTNRYFFWADDGLPWVMTTQWCTCPQCRDHSPSDQNLVVMNAILGGLRQVEPQTTLAYLAYSENVAPPKNVRPSPGIFLEFAPIWRKYNAAFEDETVPSHRENAVRLERLLEVFGTDNAQALEYWLDGSLFFREQRPRKKVKIDFHPEVLKADVAFYARHGFRSITTFGCYLDAEYLALYGKPPVVEYGAMLRGIGT